METQCLLRCLKLALYSPLWILWHVCEASAQLRRDACTVTTNMTGTSLRAEFRGIAANFLSQVHCEWAKLFKRWTSSTSDSTYHAITVQRFLVWSCQPWLRDSQATTSWKEVARTCQTPHRYCPGAAVWIEFSRLMWQLVVIPWC